MRHCDDDQSWYKLCNGIVLYHFSGNVGYMTCEYNRAYLVECSLLRAV